MIVSELCVYPVKSCQGIYLERAEVTNLGFLLDREMMLVSGSGKFITQRQFPQLAKVKVEIVEQNIVLSAGDEISPLTLPLVFTGTSIAVEIWGDRTNAIDCGDVAADWFHQLLNLDENKICRLVKRSPKHQRIVKQKYPREEDIPISFVDSYPIMLTATASLVELNQRIAEIHLSQKQAMAMNRFRPNIVIETTEPFIEDRWSIIEIGEIKFKVAKPCSRCIITTIDRQGQKNRSKEPLNTLGTFRQLSEQGVMFGIHLVPQNEGTIRLSDRLEVLETRD